MVQPNSVLLDVRTKEEWNTIFILGVLFGKFTEKREKSLSQTT